MRFLSSLLLSVSLAGVSLAQTGTDIRPGVKENPDIYNQQQPEEKPGKPVPAGAIVAALASVALVLVLICYPTRKN